MGPGPHQPRALIGQRRHLHLQHALAGGGPVAENLQNQAGPVEDLHLPELFEVALLHRAERAIDQHQLGLGRLYRGAQLLAFALAEQLARVGLAQAHDLGAHHLQIGQRARQRHRLIQRERRVAGALGTGDFGVDDKGRRDRARVFSQFSPSPS